MIKKIIEEWHEAFTPPDLIERKTPTKYYFKGVKKVYSFTGIRRCGKTYLLFQLIRKLNKTVPKENIIYINFEDERIDSSRETLTNLIPSIVELYGERNYFLFLDELQIMPNWSKWLRRVYDNYRDFNFFITGSSAELSYEYIPTELRGRTLNYEIMPLDFKEFLKFKRANFDPILTEKKKNLLKKLLREYITYGGFPEIVLEEEKKKKQFIAQDYFRTIITRDIGERNKIKKIQLLSDLLKYAINSTQISMNKIVNVFKSQGRKIGKETVINYFKFSEQSYFLDLVPIFSSNIKDREQYPKKIYFIDNSFISSISSKFSDLNSRLYENLVFLELKRRKKFNPNLEIYYYKNPQGHEVDFVVKDGLRVKQLIQVCYDIEDYDTKKREIRGLLHASRNLKCKNLLVITEDYENEEKVEWFGMKGKIKFIPAWKFLLEKNQK